MKITLFAPMPSASESTATVVNPGLLTNIRNANRISCMNVTSVLLRNTPASPLLTMLPPLRFKGKGDRSGHVHFWKKCTCPFFIQGILDA